MDFAVATAHEPGPCWGGHLDLVDALPRELTVPDLGAALLEAPGEMADDDSDGGSELIMTDRIRIKTLRLPCPAGLQNPNLPWWSCGC